MTTPYTPEQDIVAFLTSQVVTLPSGSLTLTAGTNLFSGPVLPATPDTSVAGIPSQAVFVNAGGGPAPMPYMGSGTSLYKSAVQVRTRSNPRDDVNGKALARAMRELLHTAAIQIVGAGGTQYVQCLTNEAEPLFIGLDQGGRSEFSSNFVLWNVQAP